MICSLNGNYVWNFRKPKKKIGRQLFTPNRNLSDDDITEVEEPKTVRRKKPQEEDLSNIDIPLILHKLFDSKNFGSPTSNKTPISKIENTFNEFKTPSTVRSLKDGKHLSSKLTTDAQNL